MKYVTSFVVMVIMMAMGASCSLLRPFTIEFNANGGTPIATIEVHADELIIEPNEPTRVGHTFRGWYMSSDLTQSFSFNTYPTSDLVLYAGWNVNQYSIIFLNEHGYELDTVTDDFGAVIDPPHVSTPLGYSVSGWIDVNDSSAIYTGLTIPAKNVIVKPHQEIDAFEMAIMTLTLDREIELVNQEEYVPATMSLLHTEFPLVNVEAEIRGRGNGSWSYDKKSYRIKLEDEHSLFGEEESNHWLLVPGGHDFSSLRSPTAYTLVNEVFDGIEYTTSVNFVELFVNGSYHGAYSLFEHVRVEPGRVDIVSSYGVRDTGYLLEYDAYAYGREGIDYFYVSGVKYPFAVKSPDPDEFNLEISESEYRLQVSYIKNYVQIVINAILQKDFTTFSRLADMDSIVDMYLIHELFKNTDTGWSSFYLYKKPSGKLFFGPAWDFDFTSGISRGDSSYTEFYVGDTIRYYSDFTSSEIYLSFMQQPAFISLVKTRYQEVYEDIKVSLNDFFIDTARYNDSFARDAERWYWNYNWSFDQIALKQWLLNRNDWLFEWSITN